MSRSAEMAERESGADGGSIRRQHTFDIAVSLGGCGEGEGNGDGARHGRGTLAYHQHGTG